MEYSEALQYLKGLSRFGINLGLERIDALLARLGSPHVKIPAIHIGGTNGKGSVTAMVSTICQASGLKTGRYISPALNRFNERVSINGVDIPDHEVAKLLTEIRPHAEAIGLKGEHPTEFEVVTAMAFLYFSRESVDLAVIEVGLGGRLDSTNVLTNPLAVVITNIGLEHTQILGDTLEKIAWEKAGIIKNNITVITGVTESGPLKVLINQANSHDAELIRIGVDFSGEILHTDWHGTTATIRTMLSRYPAIRIPLLGQHQVHNAAMALAVIDVLRRRGYAITPEIAINGMDMVVWPGRMELMQTNPVVIIDGAHNPDGARTLKTSIGELGAGQRFIYVLGILADKDWQRMLQILVPGSSHVVAVQPDSPRALAAHLIAHEASQYGVDVTECLHVVDGVNRALALAQPNDVVCIAGSLTTAGEARKKWIEQKGDAF